MCGRYWLAAPPSEVARLFGIDVRDNFPPRYNIAPTQPVAIIRQSEMRRREYALARWGFIPEWRKEPETKPLINARSETAAEKPSFRNAYKRRRCLLPADGFYEWKTERGAKQPYAIRRPDKEPFAFAGLWETALGPDGGELDTVAILTTAAGPDLRGLYGREPVVIDEENYALWLEADERDLHLVAPMLRARPQGSWKSYPVDPAVGNVRHDGPGLIAPLRPTLFD